MDTDTKWLSAVRACLSKATPGPWTTGTWAGRCHMKHQHGNGDCKYEYELRDQEDEYFGRYVSGPEPITIVGGNDYGPWLSRGDAAFIASARQDLPRMLSCLEAALAALPKCKDCGEPATRRIDGNLYCDEWGEEDDDTRWAAAVRRLARALEGGGA